MATVGRMHIHSPGSTHLGKVRRDLPHSKVMRGCLRRYTVTCITKPPRHGGMSPSTSPDATFAPPTSSSTAAPAMDRRHGRPHSHSSPSLHHQLDGARNSSEATAPPSRTNSQGAAAPHFFAQPENAYGGQTWVDFLRESGQLAQAQRHPHMDAQLNMNRRLPPLPHETHPRDDRFAPSPRPRSGETSSSSAERKRRSTAGESPMRRPEGRRTHEGSAGPSAGASGSAADPIVLDSPAPSQQNAGQSSLGVSSGAVRRGSEFVLPPWQPDASVTHCFVCGSQFTFFYRKHHCRYVGSTIPILYVVTAADAL